jgi:hypothetical protein
MCAQEIKMPALPLKAQFKKKAMKDDAVLQVGRRKRYR